MASPKPYKINVSQEKIDRLKQKLALADFPNELDDSGWDYGSPLADVKRLTKAWQDYDWRPAERRLNETSQFHTDIQVEGFGILDIHFVHQKSEAKDAIPLLFVHGWPGSFIEVLKLLPLLIKSSEESQTFHIVAPSLPNYGFSQGISKRGFALAQYAETCHKLMLQLGYKHYITQAGDWGFWITRAIGRLYPENCLASHYNLIEARSPDHPVETVWNYNSDKYSQEDDRGFKRTQWFEKEGRGYNLLQSTKPQTLSYGLTDSPVALLAWIYEKLHDWTDSYPWTDEEILTWVSIYYFSAAGPGAPQRIYYEVGHTPADKPCTAEKLRGCHDKVLLGLTYNPMDLYVVPSSWGKTLGPVVFEARNDKGGHFYSHEHPELLARDLRTMFKKDGEAWKRITGKRG